MAYASPVNDDGGRAGSYPVFHMPVAITVARGFQLFFAFVVMIMAGVLMHGYVFSAEAFALVCGLFTLVIALYAILTEKVASCRSGYNYWAVFSLDLFMVVFWLSSMAANAALRASFTTSASADCYDDGSAVNADSCYVYKRRSSAPIAKRDVYFASNGALALMSALSGVSALLMLLFVATFAYLAHQIRMHRQAESRGVASDDAGVVEMKTPATATTTPAYASTAYLGGSGGGAGYAEVPNPTSAATQHYAGGGYPPTYDYAATGMAPTPTTAHEAPSGSVPANYNYGQPQPSAQQYPGVAQQPHAYTAPAATPGAGPYYGPQ